MGQPFWARSHALIPMGTCAVLTEPCLASLTCPPAPPVRPLSCFPNSLTLNCAPGSEACGHGGRAHCTVPEAVCPGQLNCTSPSEGFPYAKRVQNSCQHDSFQCAPSVHHEVWITHSVLCLESHAGSMPPGHGDPIIQSTPGLQQPLGSSGTPVLPLSQPPAAEGGPTRRSCQSLHTKMLT